MSVGSPRPMPTPRRGRRGARRRGSPAPRRRRPPARRARPRTARRPDGDRPRAAARRPAAAERRRHRRGERARHGGEPGLQGRPAPDAGREQDAHRLAANRAAPNAIVPALDARTQRVRSSAGSSTGAAIRRDRATSSAPIASAAANVPSVAAELQPHVSPWTSASASAPVAPASRTAPGTSGGAVSTARDSRSRRRPSQTVSRPTGTLITKIQRQLPASTSRPPSGGPSAAATALTAPQAAIAAAHFCGGNAASNSARAAGIIAAAPRPGGRGRRSARRARPRRHRPPRRHANTRDTAQVDRRRPIRSAARPKTTSSAAKASAYALTTHDSSPRPAPLKSAAMSGNAMLTIVTSR